MHNKCRHAKKVKHQSGYTATEHHQNEGLLIHKAQRTIYGVE